MQSPNILKDYDIFKHVVIGFEFEFYTKRKREDLKPILSSYINKSIAIPYSISGHNKTTVTAHTSFVPNASVFKLEADGSGGKNMVELVTGTMNYYDAKLVASKIFMFIQEYGWTDKRCGFHFNISFNKDAKIKTSFDKLNILKFCLNYNEELIYSKFPNRINNVYAKSITNIYKLDPFVSNGADNESDLLYSVPKTKYFGVNFSKLTKNYLEFRYLGGKDYEKKFDDIFEIIEYSANELHKTLNEPFLNQKEREILQGYNKDTENIIGIFKDYANFSFYYPSIELLVNNSASPDVLKTHWNSYKYVLYDLIYKNGMKTGEINYDTDVSKYQINNTTLNNVILQGYEIVNSTVSGAFINCKFYQCQGKDLDFHKCIFYHGNQFHKGKIEECMFKSNENTFEGFWINNKKYPLLGHFEDTIVRKNFMYPDFKELDGISLYSNEYPSDDKK